MARRRGRGGLQTPNQPAPVSLPGAGSARTDGLGAAGLAADQLQHGEQKIIEGMNAPEPGRGGVPAPAGGGGGAMPPGAGAPGADVDVWGPTNQPEVPVGAGAAPMVLADDTDERLRVLYEHVFPHPHILRLMEQGDFG